ncbi:hypothetical protein C2S53_002229 [Perilla frutescens var. hirtella]|uniref:Uncharacterized protein n=1 Tax=Perilla frutescens var. hirtella TaxID=608512 RepID=A0AAD4NXV4_PERFH|nr:hypothetical protein C2S53_002229 [Perilla frutescens var. hirtella]
MPQRQLAISGREKANLITSKQSSQNGNGTQSKPRRFRSMPLGNRPSSSQIQSKTQEKGQSSGTHWESESPNNENKGKYKHKSRGTHSDYYDEDGYDSDNNMMSQNGNVRKKICTEWTQELHAKFMDAITSLGEGSLY